MMAETTVPRWQPVEFSFASQAEHPNPFAIRFDAVVRGPNGSEFLLPGFYDGHGTWKIRVAPTAEGRWTLETRSYDPALDGRRAQFTCVADSTPGVHGRLRVDPHHPHHFIFEDGTRYFLLGYECDWLWALGMADGDARPVEAFLDKLAAHGFNHIILNAYAHDTPWRRGKTGPDDYGPPPLFPWAGTNEAPDHSRFNLNFWHHYDRVIAAMYERGIVAHIMIKVYNKFVSWPLPGSEQDDMFFRWLIARYAAYPNIVWDFSKEAQNEKNLNYKLGRLRFIRDNDPYSHLITVHDDPAAYDAGHYDELADFRSDQNHSHWHETVLQQRRMRQWPVVNVEFGYEHGPGGPEDVTYQVAQPPEEIARRAWEVVTAGGYPVYYYTYTAWDVIRPDDTPPGYRYMKNLRDFFEQTRYWELEPADELVTAGRCLACRGREYVIFVNQAMPLTVRLEGAGAFRVHWFHTLYGQWCESRQLRGPNAELVPPDKWMGQPIAVLLRSQAI